MSPYHVWNTQDAKSFWEINSMLCACNMICSSEMCSLGWLIRILLLLNVFFFLRNVLRWQASYCIWFYWERKWYGLHLLNCFRVVVENCTSILFSGILEYVNNSLICTWHKFYKCLTRNVLCGFFVFCIYHSSVELALTVNFSFQTACI